MRVCTVAPKPPIGYALMRFILINIWTPPPMGSLPETSRHPATFPLPTFPKVHGLRMRAYVRIDKPPVEALFVPGEPVQIIEAVWPGGDPIAVRIGTTIFALRLREAQSVLVRVDSP